MALALRNYCRKLVKSGKSIILCMALIAVSASVTRSIAAQTLDWMTAFDESYYYDKYPDVAKVYERKPGGGIAHYLQNGIREKRSPNVFFEPEYYQQIHPDLSSFTGEQLLDHWLNHGAKVEGRRGCEDFHLKWYRDANPDVKRAYNDKLSGAFEHYLVHGTIEGRQSAPGRHLRVFPADIENVEVLVNVYKIGVAPLWHTGIVINNVEYYFDVNNNVRTCDPKGMKLQHHRTIRRMVPGDTLRVNRVLQSVISRYNGSRYDVAQRNCNVFVDEALTA